MELKRCFLQEGKLILSLMLYGLPLSSNAQQLLHLNFNFAKVYLVGANINKDKFRLVKNYKMN